MKDQDELKRLARMVLDGSARIADLRRMAELVLAEDAPEDGEDHGPVGKCADGNVITLREWVRRAFASGSPGTYPSWRYEGYAIGDRFDGALMRSVADDRGTPRPCQAVNELHTARCELTRGHGGDHRNSAFGVAGLRWSRLNEDDHG